MHFVYANFGFDTAESEPCKVCPLSAYRSPRWASLPAVKTGRVALVDGDAMFNRPGPRLVDCLEWLAATMLARPDLAPKEPFPFEWLRESEEQ